ncbi:DUF2726 domain-containing protein [Pseudovibrio sp. SPO723]|uniref:DUF2726 domain-containing protein n=1 Tax=Nesiotobacter zosterae TaxID=392721 RepID=UPI0029C3A0B3|nr:DUF2726 domain-containing protein [Pseudovibrio sp. SPO723]MDX5594822.1 DUF2726 domain-containing protein [Pseudovibrio sp. SPO723]
MTSVFAGAVGFVACLILWRVQWQLKARKRARRDIDDPLNQLRFVDIAALRSRVVMTREEQQVYKLINHFLCSEGLGRYNVFPQVALQRVVMEDQEGNPDRAIVDSALNALRGKAVSALVVDPKGQPVVAVDYLTNIPPRGVKGAQDKVKALALKKVGVGYVEVYPADLMNPTGVYEQLEAHLSQKIRLSEALDP